MHDNGVLKHANRITQNRLNLVVESSIAGYPVSIEQPSTSFLLKLPRFKAWAHKSGATAVVVDYRQYGMCDRKRTQLWCTAGGLLDGLARKCLGDHAQVSPLSA